MSPTRMHLCRNILGEWIVRLMVHDRVRYVSIRFGAWREATGFVADAIRLGRFVGYPTAGLLCDEAVAGLPYAPGMRVVYCWVLQ